MSMSRRLSGLYLIVVGLAVFIHFVVYPIYDEDGSLTVWLIFDWFMAVGLVIAVANNYVYKRFAEADPSNDVAASLREWIGANVSFYASLAVAMLFLWNWVTTLVVGGDGLTDTNWVMWAVIDVTLPLVFVTTGIKVWQRG